MYSISDIHVQQYPLMVNVMKFMLIWSEHTISSYPYTVPTMCSVCVYFLGWRSAPPTSCLSKIYVTRFLLDVTTRSCDNNTFSIQVVNFPTLQDLFSNRVQGQIYPPFHPWSQDLRVFHRRINPSNLKYLASGQSPCWGPGKLR